MRLEDLKEESSAESRQYRLDSLYDMRPAAYREFSLYAWADYILDNLGFNPAEAALFTRLYREIPDDGREAAVRIVVLLEAQAEKVALSGRAAAYRWVLPGTATIADMTRRGVGASEGTASTTRLWIRREEA
jgi:hypothetical protein